MANKIFDIGFTEGVKIASSKNPAAPVKGHDFGQPRVNATAGAYLNTKGGASAPKQEPGHVSRSHAPGKSMAYQGHTVPGGDLGVDSAPDSGDKGKSDHGELTRTKSAAWLEDMFGDFDVNA
jgi:hypothetical protein